MGVTHREREATLFPGNPIGVGDVVFLRLRRKNTTSPALLPRERKTSAAPGI